METQKELNKEILIIKTKILKAYPELNEYLNEMPEYNPSFDKQGVNTADLKDYLDSLKGILDRKNNNSNTNTEKYDNRN